MMQNRSFRSSEKSICYIDICYVIYNETNMRETLQEAFFFFFWVNILILAWVQLVCLGRLGGDSCG